MAQVSFAEAEKVVNSNVVFRRRRSLLPGQKVTTQPKRRQSVAQENSLDIIQLLQAGNAIEAVKAEFMMRKEIDEITFVNILERILNLRGNNSATVELERLFSYVDAKCEGLVTWDDFTTYCVDSAILNKISRELADNLVKWELDSDVHTVASHRPWKVKPISNATSADFFIIDASSAIFSLNEDMEASRIPVPTSGTIIDAEYVPFEDIFCCATAASELVLCDSQVTMVEAVKVPTSIQSLAWNKPAKVLCTGDRSGVLACWTVERSPTDKVRPPVLRRSWTLANAPIFAITIHRTLGTIVTGLLDGTVCVVHPVSGRKERTFNVGEGGLNCLAVSEHQNSVICGGREPVPMLWTLTNCEESKPFALMDRVQPHIGPVVTVITFPDSAQAMSLDFTGVLKVWDLRTFSCLQSFTCKMRDIKVGWSSLALSNNGTTVHACDRKNLIRLKQYDDEEHHAVKGTVVGVGCAHLSDRVLSVHMTSMRLWHDRKGTLVGEISLTTKEDVTACVLDSNGGRLFVGNSKGMVFVYNASTAGLVVRFPKAHKREVTSICFLDHANVAISCSDDGEGSILKPPALGFQSDTLFSRVQPGFRCMPSRLCLYVGAPCFMILAADEELRINVYDCKNVRSTSIIVHQSVVEFGPKVERQSRNQKKEAQVVAASSKFRRFFSAGVAFAGRSCAVVADSNTMALIALHTPGQGGPVRVVRWALDMNVDGPAITCMEVLGPKQDLRIAVGDDAGRVTVFDLNDMYSQYETEGRVSDGPFVPMRKEMDFGSITSIAMHPGHTRFALGFADGNVAYYNYSLTKMWDTTVKTTAQTVSLLEAEEQVSEFKEFVADVIEWPGMSGSQTPKAGGNRPLKDTKGIVSFSNIAKAVNESGMKLKGRKRIKGRNDDPAWVRHQLTTLCGQQESVGQYSNVSVQRPVFVTKRLKIPVFHDIDHTATCIEVFEGDSGMDTRNTKVEDDAKLMATDSRKSKREEVLNQGVVLPSYATVRKFIGRRTEDMPPLHLPKPELSATPAARLLRPLSRDSPMSSIPVPSRSSTPSYSHSRSADRLNTPMIHSRSHTPSGGGARSQLRLAGLL